MNDHKIECLFGYHSFKDICKDCTICGVDMYYHCIYCGARYYKKYDVDDSLFAYRKSSSQYCESRKYAI